MRIPRIKKGQAIEVLWEDTHIPGVPGWMSESEHAEWVENAGSLVRSVGIYVGKGRSFLQLVGDCDAEDSGEKNYLRLAAPACRPWTQFIAENALESSALALRFFTFLASFPFNF